MDAEFFVAFLESLRDEELAPATVANYMTYLQAAFNWASSKKIKILDEFPYIPIPDVDAEDAVAGRPLTTEEFERMLAKVEVGFPSQPASGIHLMRGLWLSGLRLGEAMDLFWDGDDSKINVIDETYVKLSIPAKRQKKRKRQLYPVTPDFADFLRCAPPEKKSWSSFSSQTLRWNKA